MSAGAAIEQLWGQTQSVRLEAVHSDANYPGVVVAQGVEQVAALAEVLDVDDNAVAFDCMCWGDLKFTLCDSAGKPFDSLILHFPDGLDWKGWGGGQLPLRHPGRLTEWLVEHRLALRPIKEGKVLLLARRLWGAKLNVNIVLPNAEPLQVAQLFSRAFWSVRQVEADTYEIQSEDWAAFRLSASDSEVVLSGVTAPDEQGRLLEALTAMDLTFHLREIV